MTHSVHYTDRPRYLCPGNSTRNYGCGAISIITRVDDVVVEQLHAAVKAGLLRRLRAAGPRIFSADIDAGREFDRQARQLRQDLRESRLTDDEYKSRIHSLSHRGLASRRIADALTSVDLDELARSTRTFGVLWAESTMTFKRQTLAAATRRIIVQRPATKSRHFNPDRVEIEWRA
jgi:hypothetical protein